MKWIPQGSQSPHSPVHEGSHNCWSHFEWQNLAAKKNKTGLRPVFVTGLRPIFMTGLRPDFVTGLRPVFVTGLRPVFVTGSRPIFSTGLRPVFMIGLRPVIMTVQGEAKMVNVKTSRGK